ncbi:hypothetical protein [Desulfurococcus sp.]|uniref:hypothetical protein n=1 Tax=Desulfurococcus sp. TaxID=51678 RepID=UPI00316B43A4
MKVKFKVEYGYDAELDNPYFATITLFLPEDPKEKGKLHVLLRSPKRKVLGYYLRSTIGKADDLAGVVYLQKQVYGAYWDEVRKTVTEEICEALTVLQEVKAKNERAMNTMPEDEEHEFEI